MQMGFALIEDTVAAAGETVKVTVARVGHGQFRRQRALFERVDRSATSLPSTLTFRPTPGGVRAGIAIARRVFGFASSTFRMPGYTDGRSGCTSGTPGIFCSRRRLVLTGSRSNSSSRSWLLGKVRSSHM